MASQRFSADEKHARAEAYRRGLCVDCRAAPYSAGRPRCNDCHNTHMAASVPPFVIELTLYPDQER